MPTECERTIANTSQNTQPGEQQQQQQQKHEQLQAEHLQAKAEEEEVAAAAQLEFYDDMEDKELSGGKMSTSQTSTTSATNGHSGSNQANGVGKKTSIISPDPTSYVTKARVTRPTPPPPSYNPMQFVQIKPCNLYQTAQEQLKKAEEVKKIKEIKKEEPEDWQNNLDNWKSSRRKRVEHIIDRVVEVKKLELEEHDRTRRKSKTFSEMMEERGERGGPRRAKLASLAVYNEDESNDLSDLGIGTSSASGKSSQSEDYDNNSVLSDNAELDKAIFDNNQKPSSIPAREYISSPGYDTSSSTAPGSSPDPCEYTYEGAIQDYKQRVSRASGGSALANFKLNSANTNSALISKNNSSKENTPDCVNTVANDTYPTRRGSKIEDRLIGFEVTSPSDSQEGLEKKVDVPKIDISKRKEIFESQNANSEPKSLVGNGGAGGVAVPRVTLRDRFKLDESVSNNGEVQDSTLKREVKRLSGDITSIRSRMQSLEQQQNLVSSTNGGNAGKAPSAKLVDIPVPPLKDRLSSLQNAVTKEEVRKAPVALVDARQLEIMKNEEEERRLKLIENEKKTVQEVSNVEKKEISAPVAEATVPQKVVVKIDAPEEEVDRDDSGIHTADGEIEATEISEQEQQLNAAIAALALEEQQLTEAANAVNQIEAEFAELSTSAVNAIASSLNTVSTTKATNEQPCEMEFSINEALELALDAIDKETEFTINDTATIKATTKLSNTIASSHTSNIITTNKLATTTTIAMSTKTTEMAINHQNNNNNNAQVNALLCARDTSNKTDEEKERKSKQQQLQQQFVANTHNYMHSDSNNGDKSKHSLNKDNDDNYNNDVHDDDDDVDGRREESREALISQEPIYENISAASTRQVDAEAKRIIPASIFNDNNNKVNMDIYKQMSQININNNSSSNNNDFENSFANNSLSNALTNNNNNNISNDICSYSASDNNNVSIVDSNFIELTNAFANATTTITTAASKTATTTTLIEAVASNSLIDSEKTSATAATTQITTIATAEDFKNMATTTKSIEMNSSAHTSENSSTINKPTAVDAHTVTDANATTLAEHEPYYQVPKSSEPYYDAPKHLRPVPLYENIEVFYTGLENSTLASGTGAALNGSKLEPPKEKPPPPPVESPPPFDDVDSIDNTDTWSSDNTYETISSRLPHVNGLAADHPSPPIKRMNSTKRIKKELRNKRSSFLGIDTTNLDDEETYLELTVAPPPDMAQLLQEERRLEKQLYLKAGLCDSSDTGESRDSGVSENHSRQSSEHYTNSSEENDRQIDTPPHSLKCNELIYQNEALLTAAQTPLLQTVKGNSAESWTESATVAAAATKSLTEATATANAKMLSIEEKIREQEEVLRVERELLQLEQEELKRQRENLMLRENMARRELQHGAKMLMSANRRSLQDLNGVNMSLAGGLPITNGGPAVAFQTAMPQYAIAAHNMQQPAQQQFGVPHLATQPTQQIYANVPNIEQQYYQVDIDYRKSMSDLQEFSKRHMLPPMPPTKPMRAMQVATSANALTVNGAEDFMASRHALNAQGFGGSLVKIAAPTAAPRGHSVHPINHQYPAHHSTQNLSNSSGSNNSISGVNAAPPAIPNGHAALPGNMSRNTLHALSATPKPKYTDGWVQVQQRKSFDTNLANDPAWLSAYQQKRKSMPEPYHAYNNHWLVQEAEQRRIAEQQLRRGGSTTTTPVHQQNGSANSNGKPLPDSIIQTLTERVQSKGIGERKRFDNYNNQVGVLEKSPLHAAATYYQHQQQQQLSQPITPSHQRLLSGSTLAAMPPQANVNASPAHQQPQPQQQQQDKVLSVSGKKKCSHCGDELGRGAAMIIESLLLFYHINCFKCCVCHVQLGDGLNGTDVRVRNHKLHCQNCYSSDDGIKFSCV
ncbi:serine-rich adhesin for platelets isoform X1 [Zeugodacus cucurbitae]|uniref:serine-rich adhesin for platelets isoform X1 n=2 Tax=Zeugodacus cucurbitae TaxID=28588 RepID=UPI0023D91AB0|nr:serine-rich adhesin for platelets isoform X1 [Zeugodacus cucurbitae]XP_011196987.2 serine-rich adhesin for platelets isoform X1 [Zeugodacus cucurbitae]XP_054082010.1 serine-rich adhesin for platelets isoform X1 [Zeugodacus cucurbitae]